MISLMLVQRYGMNFGHGDNTILPPKLNTFKEHCIEFSYPHRTRVPVRNKVRHTHGCGTGSTKQLIQCH